MFKSMKKTAYTLLQKKGVLTGDEKTVVMNTLFSGKALANWKAVFKIEREVDFDVNTENVKFLQEGQLVECTYNGNTDELYVDHYKLFSEELTHIKKEYIIENCETGRPNTIEMLRETVFQSAKKRLDVTDNIKFTIDDVYVVWNYGEICAMLSTTLPDGTYYVTNIDYNSESESLFYCSILIDVYKKDEHKVYTDYTKSKEEN